MSIFDNGGRIGVSGIENQEVLSPRGEAMFTNNPASGTVTHYFNVPPGVTSIDILCIGGGGGASGSPGTGSYPGFGGGGGALAYANNVSVTPGEVLTVVVGGGGVGGASGANAGNPGGNTYVRYANSTTLCEAGGGSGPAVAQATPTPGGSVVVGTGFSGGTGGADGTTNNGGGGGGGAGGYSAAGGNGGVGNSGTGTGSTGGGGGGGGGMSTAGTQNNGGGGTGILGAGSNGTGGALNNPGTGGSGGQSGQAGGVGGLYGGGGGGAEDDTAAAGGNGAPGAVRIMWGNSRDWPSTNTAATVGNSTTYTKTGKLGVLSLNSVAESKQGHIVFYDNFETFTGWTTQGSGTVVQSSNTSVSGTYSAYKTTNGDPSGAYKLLNDYVYRNWILEVWTNRDFLSGSDSDRISIIDSVGNGYGISFYATGNSVERRDAYTGTGITGATGSSSMTRDLDTWYKIRLTSNPDYSFTITTYSAAGSLLQTLTTVADTAYYGPFDRIAILGGYAYYVDDIKIIKR